MKSAAIRPSTVLITLLFAFTWTGCKTTTVKKEPEEPVSIETSQETNQEMNLAEELPAAVEPPPAVEKQMLRYGDEKQPDDIYTAQDGRIFVKSKTPIYLNIGTKLPPHGESDIILRNEATKNGKTLPKPFYFEGHGKHSLVHPPAHRHKAHKRGGPHLFYVFVDGKPPVIEPSISPVPRTDRKGVTILGKPASVKLGFSDRNSGLFSKHVSLDGESYRDYDGPLSLTEERDYLLTYYALDNVGNRTKEYRRKFSLDFTPPVSTPEIIHIYNTPEGENVLSPRSIISLSSKDDKAGVKGIYYSFGGKRKPYVKGVPIRMSKFSDGPKKLSYYATDRVANKEEMKGYSFYLDRKAPAVKFDVEGDRHRGKKALFVSGRSRGILTATDNKAGVNEIRYHAGKKEIVYSEPFSFPMRNGKYVFAYSASDNVKNRSKKHYAKVVVDVTPPKSVVSFKGPHSFSRQTHYIRKKTEIILSAKDNLSGIKNKLYSFDGGYNEAYLRPFRLDNEGKHTLAYHAVDNVNNIAEAKSITLYVDEQAPQIFHHFSVDSTVAGKKVYPKKSKLYLAATDEQAGVSTIYYRINGGKEEAYKKPLYFPKGGKYSVRVRAVDKVGNRAADTVEFSVK